MCGAHVEFQAPDIYERTRPYGISRDVIAAACCGKLGIRYACYIILCNSFGVGFITVCSVILI